MRILIATDGSEFSKAAVEKACEFIIPGRDAVKVIAVFEDAAPIMAEPGFISGTYYQQMVDGLEESAKNDVNEAENQIRKHFDGKDVDVTTEALGGFPDKTIIDEAKSWNADLIVVGSHGRGFWGRLLGSVSNGVVHHAPCSVLVVRKMKG